MASSNSRPTIREDVSPAPATVPSMQILKRRRKGAKTAETQADARTNLMSGTHSATKVADDVGLAKIEDGELFTGSETIDFFSGTNLEALVVNETDDRDDIDDENFEAGIDFFSTVQEDSGVTTPELNPESFNAAIDFIRSVESGDIDLAIKNVDTRDRAGTEVDNVTLAKSHVRASLRVIFDKVMEKPPMDRDIAEISAHYLNEERRLMVKISFSHLVQKARGLVALFESGSLDFRDFDLDDVEMLASSYGEVFRNIELERFGTALNEDELEVLAFIYDEIDRVINETEKMRESMILEAKVEDEAKEVTDHLEDAENFLANLENGEVLVNHETVDHMRKLVEQCLDLLMAEALKSIEESGNDLGAASQELRRRFDRRHFIAM